MKLTIIILFSILTVSCNSQEKDQGKSTREVPFKEKFDTQIAEYIISAYQDSKGQLWFGTLAKGIAKYDGNELVYFTKKHGLPTNRVTSIIEDKNGIYWLNTGQGLTKYDGTSFTNYVVKENDFLSNMISHVFIDSKGVFWVGTWGGVYIFDGLGFTPFELPYPAVSTVINPDTKHWITDITEDLAGNIWFARDGYGACRYDGESFIHFLKKDGLHANYVTGIEIDDDENIWFGTRVAEMDNPDPTKREGRGGVNQLLNNKMITFPAIKGFNTDDVYEIYKGNSGNVWISTKLHGVYKYDGHDFKNYPVPISITGMLHDQSGTLWLAGAGGLYKITPDDQVSNVTIKGPWK